MHAASRRTRDHDHDHGRGVPALPVVMTVCIPPGPAVDTWMYACSYQMSRFEQPNC